MTGYRHYVVHLYTLLLLFISKNCKFSRDLDPANNVVRGYIVQDYCQKYQRTHRGTTMMRELSYCSVLIEKEPESFRKEIKEVTYHLHPAFSNKDIALTNETRDSNLLLKDRENLP